MVIDAKRLVRLGWATALFGWTIGACTQVAKLDEFEFVDVCSPEALEVTCKGVECGPRTNNCGQSVTCPDTCPTNADGMSTCGDNEDKDPNRCACVPDSLEVTCKGVECGPRTNNCGQSVTCPDTCPSKGDGTQTCGDNVEMDPNRCGCVPEEGKPTKCCVPESIEKLCFGVQCGTKKDKCGQARECPNSCVAPDTCGDTLDGDPNQCGCTSPTEMKTCETVQCGDVKDRCGIKVSCPSTCAPLQGCEIGGAPKNVCGCTGAPMLIPDAPVGCERIKTEGRAFYVCGLASQAVARKLCQSFGTDLVRPTNATKNQFVASLVGDSVVSGSWFGADGGYWIGVEDPDCTVGACNFKWVDGATLLQTTWNVGEPNNTGGGEHCVEAKAYYGGWNDIPCANSRGVVCETTCP